ncbi:hypothetical protein ASZ78_008915 [Callipepla squamata]|uniref:Calcium-binding and coiled-coil domain-containing protein 2 n=1 Tax=Callipepla squamata TaxID=9009 RepID=A0A226N8J6_CALSU|nr:hypothetical protein ASZ78_008915 [Callipepla squamata]
MDETSDEPPTSAVLLDKGHFSQVIFNNVEKFYVPGGDVTCYYTLTQNIVPHGKDWVGIFRVGWKTTREYYTFMWAPRPSNVHGGTAVQQQIQFKAYYLPKDDEYYQFCYIDQDGMIRGASVPFQFRAEMEDDILVVTTQGEVEEIELQNKNLLKENEELQANCASLQKQNRDLQEELKKTQELQNALESLRSSTEKLELELNSLRKENKDLKELNECREVELNQFKEQIQNVTSEKEHLETKLKAALDHVDHLQSRLLNCEKEIENLVHVDQDKTKQCESLKEENNQLCVTITQKQQNSDLMKELEEQRHLIQNLQAAKKESDEKNQKLRKENDSLLRRLTKSRGVSSSSASQGNASVPTREMKGFVFGDPYHAARESHKTRAIGIDSGRKCPVCNDVFPDDIDIRDYEAHVQSHLLECPVCNETFITSNQQVFDDHIYCHSLEKL